VKLGRIDFHPVLGPLPVSRAVRFRFDGVPVEAREGETIAASLLAEGVRKLRAHEHSGAARGIYCNIGHCMECRVAVDGRAGVRACLTLVSEGMDVRSGVRLPAPFREPVPPEGRGEP